MDYTEYGMPNYTYTKKKINVQSMIIIILCQYTPIPGSNHPSKPPQ